MNFKGQTALVVGSEPRFWSRGSCKPGRKRQ